MKTLMLVSALALFPLQALACDPTDHRDMVRAQEKQAKEAERQTELMRQRNKMIDRDIRNRN